MRKVRHIEAFHSELLLMQLRMRWLWTHTPGRIDPGTSNLLHNFARGGSWRAKDLCETYKMSAVQVSRLLARFEDQGLILRRRAADDARQKQVELSPKGKLELDAIIRHDNLVAKAGLHPLTRVERDRLALLLEPLSAGLGAPTQGPLPGEEPFVALQKLVARALGMLGGDYLDSGLDIASYQMCFALYESAAPIRFRDLKRRLLFNPSYLSREGDRLAARGWCRKQAAAAGTGVLLELTDEGRREFGSIHAAATARLAQAMRGGLEERLPELIALFSRVNRSELVIPSVAAPPAVKRCRRPVDYYRARAALVEWLVAAGRHRRLPPTLLPDDLECYCIYHGRQLVGLGALERRGVRSAVLVQFERAPAAAEMQEDIWNGLLEYLAARIRVEHLEIAPGIAKRQMPHCIG